VADVDSIRLDGHRLAGVAQEFLQELRKEALTRKLQVLKLLGVD
jgi:hypothetical protein